MYLFQNAAHRETAWPFWLCNFPVFSASTHTLWLGMCRGAIQNEWKPRAFPHSSTNCYDSHWHMHRCEPSLNVDLFNPLCNDEGRPSQHILHLDSGEKIPWNVSEQDIGREEQCPIKVEREREKKTLERKEALGLGKTLSLCNTRKGSIQDNELTQKPSSQKW